MNTSEQTYRMRLNTAYRTVRTSNLARHIGIMLSGNIASQLITVAISPVLSRLYDATAFGIYGQFAAAWGIFGVCMCLRYEQAIVVAETDDESRQLTSISLILMAAIFAAFVFVSLGLSHAGAVQISGVEPWQQVVFLSTGVLVVGFDTLFTAICIRKKAFDSIAKSLVIQAITTIAIQIACHDWNAIGLIIGYVAGFSAKAIYLLWPALNGARLSFLRLRATAVSFRDFPIYDLPQRVAFALSLNLPVFILAYFSGDVVVGAYVLAVRILQKPMSAVSISVRQVLFEKASALQRDGMNEQILPLFMKSTLGLSLLCLIPTMLVILFGPFLFTTILGSQWRLSGQQSQWLILWLMTTVVTMPSDVVLRVLRQQRELLIYRIAEIVIRLGVLIAACYLCDSLTAIAMFSVAGLLLNVLLVAFAAVQISPTAGLGTK